ncbi:MAG: hypothetical protein U7126_27285 [Microcoleus sp.]
MLKAGIRRRLKLNKWDAESFDRDYHRFLVHLKWTLAVRRGLKSPADSRVHSQTVALRRMCSFQYHDRSRLTATECRMSGLRNVFTFLNCS